MSFPPTSKDSNSLNGNRKSQISSKKIFNLFSSFRSKSSDSNPYKCKSIPNIEEITLEKHDSDADSELEKLKINSEEHDVRTATSGSGGSSSISLAPRWVYGTTLPPPRSSRNSSSAVSGLCLTERGQLAVAQPEVIQNFLFPTTEILQKKIFNYRENLIRLLSKDINDAKDFDSPLLVITGPTYISDPNQAKACAQWVGTIIGKRFNNLPENLLPENVLKLFQRKNIPKHLLLSIRTNLTKYNFNYDDASLIKGHNSIMTFEIEHGIPICRALLCELAEICPIVGEASDTITPQYLSDLFCLGVVSSTLIESQLHRELVSGVSYTIGFNTSDSNLPFDKEYYSHKITSALDAMYASAQSHQFLSITKIGTVAVVGTIGNEDTFIILQLNLQLTYQGLKEIIDRVYSYPKLNFTTPKIMLDVGRLSNEDYAPKLDILRKLLTGEKKYKIIGVLIDSGDNYIPKGYHIDLVEKANTELGEQLNDIEETEENQRKLIELNRYFVKKRIYKNISDYKRSDIPTKVENLEKYYEYFINADKMIDELEELSELRIKS